MTGMIDRLAPRPAGTSTGKSVLLLVITRLVSRVALHDLADWYDQTMLRAGMGRPPEEFTEVRLFWVLDSIGHQEASWMWDVTWFISDALRRKAEELWGPESRHVYYDRTQMLYHGGTCSYAELSHTSGTSKDRRKIGMGVAVRQGDCFP